MRIKIGSFLNAIVFMLLVSCSQNNCTVENTVDEETVKVDQKTSIPVSEPHRYGGWYCPDNLNGFPAVDINDWQNVPVVNDRMATKEETQNGTSLIFVDMDKYPNAKPLNMTMPKLAKYNSNITSREELIIIIQALNIDNDSIVGFRYLNGGNGSARLSEVKLLEKNEVEMIAGSRFIALDLIINATDEEVWEVLTDSKKSEKLLPSFSIGNQLSIDWRSDTNVNFKYSDSGTSTASYANKLFGNYYIQNDYKNLNFSEKFLLLRNDETESTVLKIVCGPYGKDYETQKEIIDKWAERVKTMCEEG